MIYLAFAFWLFAIVLTARGILTLWAKLVKPRYLAIALIPGTLTAELGYLLGCLLSGAEVRVSHLFGKATGDGEESSSPKGVPYLTPVLTGMLPLAACIAMILLISTELGHPVFQSYRVNGVAAPKALPFVSGQSIWLFLEDQVHLLRDLWNALAATLNNYPWRNWKAWLFQYMLICLIVRMAPNGRPMRPALLGTAVVAGTAALGIAVGTGNAEALNSAWPLLSYVWASALGLLAMTLLIHGAFGLARMVRGR